MMKVAAFALLAVFAVASAQVCVNVDDTEFCSGLEKTCSVISGDLAIETYYNSWKAGQEAAASAFNEDTCKTAAEIACPNDPDSVDCSGEYDSSKDYFCDYMSTNKADGGNGCSADADCQLLSCYSDCTTCQDADVCDTYATAGIIAADGEDCAAAYGSAGAVEVT